MWPLVCLNLTSVDSKNTGLSFFFCSSCSFLAFLLFKKVFCSLTLVRSLRLLLLLLLDPVFSSMSINLTCIVTFRSLGFTSFLLDPFPLSHSSCILFPLDITLLLVGVGGLSFPSATAIFFTYLISIFSTYFISIFSTSLISAIFTLLILIFSPTITKSDCLNFFSTVISRFLCSFTLVVSALNCLSTVYLFPSSIKLLCFPSVSLLLSVLYYLILLLLFSVPVLSSTDCVLSTINSTVNNFDCCNFLSVVTSIIHSCSVYS